MPMAVDSLQSSKQVCVVGAGPSGLISARELLKEGHSVVVLEQNHDLGGQWLYQDADATATVHSSVYASLRVNAPRTSMEFTDFMFTPVEGRDARNFPGHRELFLYLKDFARCFGLTELIRFNAEVVHVGLATPTHKWIVRSRDRRTDGGEFAEEIFDAVVVATGPFSLPRLPKIRGMEEWKRKQLHCHVYRIPDPFQDEVVVVVGGSISGPEIALELVHVAKEVHISTKNVEIPEKLVKPVAKHEHLHWHQEIELLCEDGTVLFADGSSVVADTILYCTGYSYSFPFLDTKGIIHVDENRIGPLYEHTFPPSLAPSLSFVGIPNKFIIFRFLESQARWIAQVLSGKRKLPSADELMKAIEEVERLQELEEPKTFIQLAAELLEYYDRYGDQCDFPHLEDWRREIILKDLENCLNNIETFRDE
ncbi:flavin-containing monooxygenase FMO GS-OX-like 8 isoform X1 [Zingiber officinale]|uniref:flavin-containing monooxygenase FMO GS-OX-like 8 isoform X1 n=1 Tax=Zingiber officinale TaxID=94328 RepID=UPI001C4B9371|nr:flavin-containing monooxygenase FMO GS-OX-like 8 isoform X1 [Zingiber officinale]